MKIVSALKYWLFLVFFSSALFVLLTPAYRVEFLDGSGEAVLSFSVYQGQSFSTGYIHSVQLCPVVDEYCVVGGSMWLLEERTQSTNAGLPTEAPRLGRFVHSKPWYRYIGGRRAFQSVRLRVGDDKIGINILTLPSGEVVKLYERFPGKLLTMRLR
ncbi:hypothetical protein FACS1894204_03440 [Synergistales bacterium]|nr:hypothetical protein FACS1894204_03440 [Synergistales bacterium]